MSNRHKKDGFTLIEIAAALMVFALLSVSILVLQGQMTRRARSFVEAFQDLAEAKNTRVKLEREQQLTQKERIDIPAIVPLSYQFMTISEKSALHSFSKMVGVGMIEVKYPRGFVDHFFSIVPLPIEIKTATKPAAQPEPKSQPKTEKKTAPVGKQLMGKKNA